MILQKLLIQKLNWKRLKFVTSGQVEVYNFHESSSVSVPLWTHLFLYGLKLCNKGGTVTIIFIALHLMV